MAIIKAKVDQSFTVIPNETLKDKNLSMEARGLLAFMLSLPDDWVIYKDWLRGQAPMLGRDKLTRILKELQDFGYVRKIPRQDEGGRLAGVDWMVYPSPECVSERRERRNSGNPTAGLENRTTEKPSDGKPATTKERSTQKKDINNKDHLTDEVFLIFWKAWPKKSNPKGSYAKFNATFKRLCKEQGKSATQQTKEKWAQMLVSDIQKRMESKQFGFDAMHATTYLNQERWHDEISTNNGTVNSNYSTQGAQLSAAERTRQLYREQGYDV